MDENEDEDETALYHREWLNLPGFYAGAYVIAEVHRCRDRRGEPSLSGTLTIADCSRVVTLDFDAWDAEDVRNATHKLRMLGGAMGAFAAALTDGFDWLARARSCSQQVALPFDEPVRT
jgi:hypothetical protein